MQCGNGVLAGKMTILRTKAVITLRNAAIIMQKMHKCRRNWQNDALEGVRKACLEDFI